METKGEFVVTVLISIIALLVIVGGFASFSGLATYAPPITIETAKQQFRQGDVFDVTTTINPTTLLADESMTVYVDGNLAGVVAIKKYLDDNKIDYGSEIKNLGENNIKVINMQNKLTINLADLVSPESISIGEHILRVELSGGDASAETAFKIE